MLATYYFFFQSKRTRKVQLDQKEETMEPSFITFYRE
jgi:hypothetical protein